jgi:hypothetical protein
MIDGCIHIYRIGKIMKLDSRSKNDLVEEIIVALSKGHYGIAQSIVDEFKNFPANALDQTGQDTLLTWTARYGNTEDLDFILDAFPTVNVNGLNMAGQTPLMAAANSLHYVFIQDLKESGKSIALDTQDRAGQTALDLAILRNPKVSELGKPIKDDHVVQANSDAQIKTLTALLSFRNWSLKSLRNAQKSLDQVRSTKENPDGYFWWQMDKLQDVLSKGLRKAERAHDAARRVQKARAKRGAPLPPKTAGRLQKPAAPAHPL